MNADKIKAEVEENKNKHDVRCNYCNSLVLKAHTATYVEQEIKLPLMQIRKKNDQVEIDFEQFNHFWHVSDMFDFENVGFTHTLEDKKFLTCADCEMGPIGYKSVKSNNCYVAIQRVRHGSADTGVTSELNTAMELEECGDSVLTEKEENYSNGIPDKSKACD